jgi:hypothetical protein
MRTNRVRPAFAGLLMVAAVTAGCGRIEGVPIAYDLPPEPGTYRLTLDHENVHSEWEFSSRVVTTDETPPGYACVETIRGTDKPCRPQPLIFLRYDAGVGLDNKVQAARSGRLRVTAYRVAAGGPQVTGLNLWISTDDGEHWQQVKTRERGQGRFDADVRYPSMSRTTGAVSLKALAWDSGGNRVSQTLERAFGLREGKGPQG